ncbi:TonB protein C-terminal [Catalinimonas alkaloidigena]|uniref:TonB protein C-terminal n=1 Tax=Catalinimonas alkaloidigena TaxID=1075417 RepID=A0A1G9GPA3_9BACT|nr:carboxypeptidase-like regulatory domain-containing protein [Catalinimonas alkaloidigena]SDL02494.1 TonB protein C-terminal [Catalinimonas alkaloidigena]
MTDPELNRPTPEQLERFRKGELSPAAQQRVEAWLAEHPFHADAAEGWAQLPPERVRASLDALNQQLRARTQGDTRTSWGWMVAAASVLLCLVTGSVWWMSGLQPDPASVAVMPPVTSEVPSPETDAETSPPGTEVQSAEAERAQEEAVAQLPPPDRAQAQKKSAPAARHDAAPPAAKSKAARAFADDEAVSLPQANNLPTQVTARPPVASEADLAYAPPEVTPFVLDTAEKPFPGDTLFGLGEVRTVRALHGQVVLAGSDKPIPGARVAVKGKPEVTTTDMAGRFALPKVEHDDALVISSSGYRTQEVAVGQQASVVVPMAENAAETARLRAAEANAEATPELPQPVGGYPALYAYMRVHLRYPEAARPRADSTTRVLVEATVQTDGTLTDFHVPKDPGFGFAEEAVRVLREGPKWIAAPEGSQKIRVWVDFPRP